MKQNETAPGKAEADAEHIVRSLQGTYPRKADIALQELFQNTSDAHGINREKEIIPEGRVVDAKMEILPDENAIEFTDKGAGGMSENDMSTVVRVGDSTKRESGSGGGSFGLGLWMLTHLAEEGSGIYIESKYEETGKTNAIALFNDTNRVLPESPSEVRKKAGVSNIKSTSPIQWNVGGTLIRVEDVSDYVIEQLCDWEEVEEHLTTKFPFIDSMKNLNFDYVIDGDVKELNTPSMDEVVKSAEREEESISVQSGDIENNIDEFVVFNAGTEKPWGDFVPLMKSRPHFDEPYLVVDTYTPSEASSIVNRKERLGAYAIIDTICDEDNAEEIAHNQVAFKPYRTRMKDICQEEHKKIVEENPQEFIEIDETEMKVEAESSIEDMTSDIYNVVDDPETAGIKYRKRAEVSVSPNHESDNIAGEVTIEKSETYNGRLKIRVDFEGHRQEGDKEKVIEDARMVNIEEDEDETSFDVCWEVDEDGSYYFDCKITDVRAGKVIDNSGAIVGVNKDVTSSNQRQAGATLNAPADGEVNKEVEESEVDELLDLGEIEVKDVVFLYSEETTNNNSPWLKNLEEEGKHKYELRLPITWEKLQDTLTLQEKDREEEQRRLIESKVKELTFMRLYKYTEGSMSRLDTLSDNYLG